MNWKHIIYILAAAIVLLGITIVVPWNKIKKWWEKKKNPKDVVKNKIVKMEIITKKKPKYMGIYNFFGAKKAISLEDLTFVVPEPDACELCRPFENKILSQNRVSSSYITMYEAMSRGYHHVGCSHKDEIYEPGITKIPISPFTIQDQIISFNKRLEQYRWEHQIRDVKYRIKNALNIEAKKQYEIEWKKLEKRYKIFLEMNNLQRNLLRENILDNRALQFN